MLIMLQSLSQRLFFDSSLESSDWSTWNIKGTRMEREMTKCRSSPPGLFMKMSQIQDQRMHTRVPVVIPMNERRVREWISSSLWICITWITELKISKKDVLISIRNLRAKPNPMKKADVNSYIKDTLATILSRRQKSCYIGFMDQTI